MANDEDARAGLSADQPRADAGRAPVAARVGRAALHARSARAMDASGCGSCGPAASRVVSTYVPWLHHEPVRGEVRFDGRFDVAAFVDAVRAEGLEVVLRIGPWVHGEMRNGGFPDWVQHAPVRTAPTTRPTSISCGSGSGASPAPSTGAAAPTRCSRSSSRTSCTTSPGHLVTLKRLAREAGLSAPLWTATAWGGADLPDPEVLPLWGGYGDGFWVDPGEPWDPTFRAHYFFSDTWDDPGIGADVRATGRPRRPAAPPSCRRGSRRDVRARRRHGDGVPPPAAAGRPRHRRRRARQARQRIGVAGLLHVRGRHEPRRRTSRRRRPRGTPTT